MWSRYALFYFKRIHFLTVFFFFFFSNYRIVYVRETRLTAIISHVAIGFSLFGLRYLAYIPTPVLYGLFLYVAVTALYDNQMFERISLLFKEQVKFCLSLTLSCSLFCFLKVNDLGLQLMFNMIFFLKIKYFFIACIDFINENVKICNTMKYWILNF